MEAVIGMVKATNHRFRVVTIFRRGETRVWDGGSFEHETEMEAAAPFHPQGVGEAAEQHDTAGGSGGG
jgi:hypothetical protein